MKMGRIKSKSWREEYRERGIKIIFRGGGTTILDPLAKKLYRQFPGLINDKF
jgi:hypothetical protein